VQLGLGVIVALVLVGVSGCASRPRPTAESLRRAANPRAIIEGRVHDGEGKPVAGVSVQGLPREKHLVWSPASVTDEQGRFRLELVAPGEYGFLISWKGITVVTPNADDPSRVPLSLAPGERRAGIELLFRREEWERALLSPRAP
jgi:Carboxypeptidase regulatory-like domain